ncbi:cadherin-like protein 26 isoform X2 [Protopterus annectens]|uniref:cadherin-like protein 26 isoform X2 n=1 Tax=Protopterus annectens TaxID=7888 RepID=UPI001CF96CBB|nr:cadherin-like protein 26 isoform X2 [Protopterus annectens]
MKYSIWTLVVLGFMAALVHLSFQNEEKAKRHKSLQKRDVGMQPTTKAKVLRRQKRVWIIDAFSIVEEDKGPFPKTIGKINLERDYAVLYTISGPGVDEDPKSVFFIDLQEGTVFATQSIDYEQYRVFKLVFNAVNRTNFQTDTRLGIQILILDINDNAPLFSKRQYSFRVNESIAQGVAVARVIATDRDEPGTPNSAVIYSIVSQNPPSTINEFKIDPNIGTISFKGCLKYEDAKKYKVLVQARDDGQFVKLSSTVEVIIDLLDENNNLPVPTKQEYTGEINESEENVTVVTIQVTDNDTANTDAWKVIYKIVSGNEMGNFKIETNPKTNEGVLKVIKALDFEGGDKRQLNISIENIAPYFSCRVLKKVQGPEWKVEKLGAQEGVKTVNVTVKILDVNDPPEFRPPVLFVYKDENLPSGTFVGKVTAFDNDKAFPNTFRYSIGKDVAEWVRVDYKTGEVKTKKILDRESPHVINNMYNITVLATDDGVPPLTGTGTLAVILKDLNDNVPELQSNFTSVCESDSEQTISIVIEDKDLDPFSGPFHFELLDSEDYLLGRWTLEEKYGYVLHLKMAKTAVHGSYILHFKISDRQGLYSYQNLTVRVCLCHEGTDEREPACFESRNSYTPGLNGPGIIILFLSFLFLLAALLALLYCTCKDHPRISIDKETEYRLMVHNEEGGTKDCEVPDVGTGKISQKEFTDTMDGKLSGNFGTISGRQTSTYQEDLRNAFLLSTMSKHSLKEEQRFHQQGSSYRSNTIGGFSFMHMQNILKQRLQQYNMETDVVDNCSARIYAYEGEPSLQFSLDDISIQRSNFNLDSLQDMGPKFKTLETICKEKNLGAKQ